jgi:uncharacterized protein YbbC (DUF1343 family)
MTQFVHYLAPNRCLLSLIFFFSSLLVVCASAQTTAPLRKAPQKAQPLLLGIDVLEKQGFGILKGKRIGLLTHPAGVNRFGLSTIEVIRRDRQNNLVALFGPEHGIYGDEKANEPIDNRIDPRTKLPVFSLYGRYRKPTPKMLLNIDTLVIDLQDLGTRSYTYISCMRLAIEACFENNVEVVVLDRPNPLGGLKVNGPPMDKKWMSYVGAYQMPYVHGLTIGEIARISASRPGILKISENLRQKGNLVVIRMKGWSRKMTWPQTGLAWVPTSPNIPTFEAVVGYSMTGLGAQLGGFRHGVGGNMPFRILTFRGQPLEKVQREFNRHPMPGLRLVPRQFKNSQGQIATGLYTEITDWESWRPTEVSFWMMKIACKLNPPNPFVKAKRSQANLFNKHVGSSHWWNTLTTQGYNINVDTFIKEWDRYAASFQRNSRPYWLYQ